jgi:hypothetical protein
MPEFFSGYLSGEYFTSANADWQIVMNTFDLETSHKFIIGRAVISPTMGIRGATIDQKINIQYNASLSTAQETLKNNFYGAGPSFGVNGALSLPYNVSFIGDISTALLWGNWNIKDTYSGPSAFLGAPTTITTSLNNSELGTLMFNYFLGLEWSHQLTASSSVAVRLGYEMQYWANQLRLVLFEQLPTHGDLTVQGLTCGIHFHF